jgi:hypothetical protein
MVSPKLIIGLLIFILSIHILATIYYWYWTVGWLDMPMHFLGGFWVAMAATALISNFQFPISNEIFKQKKLSFFIVILSFVALIGVLWEFFEFGYDVLISSKEYLAAVQQGVGDTMSDLFFDLLGGLVFLVIYKFQLSKKSNIW